MRVVATNPDALGDLVLRQPLFAGIAGAGHELTLVVHARHAPLAGRLAPGAGLITFSENPYRGRLRPENAAFDAVASAVRHVRPDVLIVAPFQWTALDARVAAECADARKLRLSGRSWAEGRGDPSMPLDGFEVAEVEESMPEVEKNHALLELCLGRSAERREPTMAAHPRAIEAGRSAAAELLGGEGERYWVACIGEGEFTRVRNWPLDRWTRAMRAWGPAWGSRFILVGIDAERESMVRVAAEAGGSLGRVWVGEADALLTLEGLIAAGEGFIGRDTGPMHIAAALGKRVLAVFGGGTYPRFLPRAWESISITVDVPCAGCGWACHLTESVCIGEVPEAEVIEAGHRLARGDVREREVRVLQPGADLLERIGREGAAAVRAIGRRVQLSVRRAATGDLEPGARDVPSSFDDARRLAAERLAIAGEHGRARVALAAELASVRERCALAELEVARLQQALRVRPAMEEGIRVAGPEPIAAQRGQPSESPPPAPDRDAMSAELAALRRSLLTERERADAALAAAERASDELRAMLVRSGSADAKLGALEEALQASEREARAAEDRAARAAERLSAIEADLAGAEEKLSVLLGSRWSRLGRRLGVGGGRAESGEGRNG